jgi:hypothetical protein
MQASCEKCNRVPDEPSLCLICGKLVLYLSLFNSSLQIVIFLDSVALGAFVVENKSKENVCIIQENVALKFPSFLCEKQASWSSTRGLFLQRSESKTKVRVSMWRTFIHSLKSFVWNNMLSDVKMWLYVFESLFGCIWWRRSRIKTRTTSETEFGTLSTIEVCIVALVSVCPLNWNLVDELSQNNQAKERGLSLSNLWSLGYLYYNTKLALPKKEHSEIHICCERVSIQQTPEKFNFLLISF